MGPDELLEQSSLVRTGRAHQPHHLPLSRFDVTQEVLQDDQLPLPPHEST
jgi:hypothetical protein